MVSIEQVNQFISWKSRYTDHWKYRPREMAARIYTPAHDAEDLAGNVSKLKEFIAVMEKAPLVVWKLDLWEAAQVGNQAFRGEHLPESLWLQGAQFWFLDAPLTQINHLPQGWITVASDGSDGGKQRRVVAYLTGVINGQWTQHVLCESVDAKPGELPHMHFYPPISRHDTIRYDVEPVAAGSLLSLSLCATSPVAYATRQMQRQSERKGKPLPEVVAVHLRRYEQREGDKPDTDTDWSCCWTVSGHWRKQWYRSKQRHEAVWIDPYIKGDLSKPLRTPKANLYVVDR